MYSLRKLKFHQQLTLSMLSTVSNANQDDSKETDILRHYSLLVHFLPRHFRGELWGGKRRTRIPRMAATLYHIVSDEIHDFISLQVKKVLGVGGQSEVFTGPSRQTDIKLLSSLTQRG